MRKFGCLSLVGLVILSTSFYIYLLTTTSYTVNHAVEKVFVEEEYVMGNNCRVAYTPRGHYDEDWLWVRDGDDSSYVCSGGEKSYYYEHNLEYESVPLPTLNKGDEMLYWRSRLYVKTDKGLFLALNEKDWNQIKANDTFVVSYNRFDKISIVEKGGVSIPFSVSYGRIVPETYRHK